MFRDGVSLSLDGNSQKRIHLLIKVMGLAHGLYALKGAIFFIGTGGQGMVEAPEGYFLAANNSLGIALVMNLPLLFYLIKVESNVWLRRLFKAMLIASYPAVIGTFSRGAWVALAIVTVLLFWRTERKAILLTGGVVLTLLTLILFPSIISKRVSERAETLENVDEDATSQQRLWSWEFCKRVGLANPIVGAGFQYYSRSAYAKYYPEMEVRWPERLWSCHSAWFTILSEHGVVGFLLWIGLMISCFMSLRRVRSYARGSPETGWALHLAGAIQVSMLGFIIGGTFSISPISKNITN